YHRGVLSLVLKPSYETYLFLLEMVVGLILPIALLTQRRIRETAGGLYLAAVLAILGFVANRLNVSITGMEGAAHVRYVPKWTEMAITAMFIAMGFFLFGVATKYLPIFPEERPRRPHRLQTPAAAAMVEEPVPGD